MSYVDAAIFAPLEGADPALPGQPFSRVRYSYGQLLGAEDFTADQRYHLLRARLRNALLHGSGVVCGLDVTSHALDDPPSAELRCSPGLAIDPLGREILVAEPICLDITGLANNPAFWPELSPPPGETEGSALRRCYVVLTYRACLADQAPTIAPPCSDADQALGYIRVLDSYRLCLAAEPPPDPHELSRDWTNLDTPPALRARLQTLMTGAPPNLARLWGPPEEAAVLLATVDLEAVGTPVERTEVEGLDTSVRALLPNVQTLAEQAFGVRLVGPAGATAVFSLSTVTAAKGAGAGSMAVTLDFSADVLAPTITDTSVRLFKLDADVWKAVAVTFDPAPAGNVVTLKVAEDWTAATTYQVAVSGGVQPVLDKDHRPLAGLSGEPPPVDGAGRDAALIRTFTP
jgi:hypothetical protein